MPPIRPPSPLIRQWDNNACETACAAQLLYMQGKLEVPFNTAAFDRRVGRSPGGFDIACGNLRVLLEAGFRIIQYCNIDPRRVIADPSYRRQVWIDAGDTPEEVDEYFAEKSVQVCALTQNALRVITSFPGKHRQFIQIPTWNDVEQLLKGDHIVAISIYAGDGSTHYVLITRKLGRNKYETFWPDKGVLVSRQSAFRGKLINIEGYRTL